MTAIPFKKYFGRSRWKSGRALRSNPSLRVRSAMLNIVLHKPAMPGFPFQSLTQLSNLKGFSSINLPIIFYKFQICALTLGILPRPKARSEWQWKKNRSVRIKKITQACHSERSEESRVLNGQITHNNR